MDRFYGGYSLAWTPLPYLYVTEIMPYSLRTKGLAIYTIFNQLGSEWPFRAGILSRRLTFRRLQPVRQSRGARTVDLEVSAHGRDLDSRLMADTTPSTSDPCSSSPCSSSSSSLKPKTSLSKLSPMSSITTSKTRAPRPLRTCIALEAMKRR